MQKNKFTNSIIDYFVRLDKYLFLIIIFISLFALIILQSVSRATTTDYYQTQLFAVILGSFGAFIISNIDYRIIGNFWILLSGFSLFLMVFTIFFGINISGEGGVNATAWIDVAGRTFQSSELVKICFIVTFAKHAFILKKNGTLNQPLQVLYLTIHGALPVLLCHAQGDDGAGVVFFLMFVFMAYAIGVKARYFVILAILVAIALPILWNFVLSDYQKIRFSAVYNLDDPNVALNYGYQQYQARISIGSGGLFGTGLFNGPRVESNRVTFQHSDFVFSVVGEELGFIGCIIVMGSLILLVCRAIYIANHSRDELGKTMCYGFIGLVITQAIFNIGMCLALLPVMGVTLPFYSAGGSSAACLYLGIGILESVYMHKDYVGGVRLRYKPIKELGYRDLIK